jgi:hypothetical protein
MQKSLREDIAGDENLKHTHEIEIPAHDSQVA